MYHIVFCILRACWPVEVCVLLTVSVRNGRFAVFVESLSWFCLTATFESQEELCSDSVERIVVNPNAAYDKFKDKHVNTKGLGQYHHKQFDLSFFGGAVLL